MNEIKAQVDYTYASIPKISLNEILSTKAALDILCNDSWNNFGWCDELKQYGMKMKCSWYVFILMKMRLRWLQILYSLKTDTVQYSISLGDPIPL